MLNWLKTLPARTLALLRAGLERIKRDGPPLLHAGLERVKRVDLSLLHAGLERVKRVDLSLFRTGLERVKRDGLRWLRVGLGIVVSILVLGGLLWAVWVYWDWLATVPQGRESRSTTARNVGLVIGGVIAIMLALWRSIVAHRQALTAQRQALTAQSQAEIAQRRLMDERYQKATEMLGSGLLSVRLGGIYALRGLAEEDPEQYHVQIIRLFCAFVRHPTKDERVDKKQKKTLLGDIQAIVEMIRTRSDANIALEKEENLLGLDLSDADLPRSVFDKADLSKANLMDTDLSEAFLENTNLAGAYLAGATLSGADLKDANVSGTTFFYGGIDPAKGLTQAQLNEARADRDHPPDLNGCVDAETKEPLVWNGKLL